MELIFDEARLRRRLEALPPFAVLAFALSCAERLLPNYEAFVRQAGWGDPAVLRAALDAAWEALAGRPAADDLRSLARRCEAVTPDSEDFETPLVSAALDAGVAATLVLDLVATANPATAAQVASLAHDSVDMHIQESLDLHPDDPRREAKIFAHPLMQRELARQSADLDRLEGVVPGPTAAKHLLARWRSPERGSLDLATGARVDPDHPR